jgi:hypothetical protein
MTTYNVFPETTIATPHLTPAQAVSGASVVFTGNSPYDFEQAAALAAGLVVGTTYTIDQAYTSVGNPTISLREKNTIPTDGSGAAVKRPVFDMYMFTLAA